MEKAIIILGPTATGKTDLALKLAKKFNGELIACDSRQVYQGLDIGTGKLPGGQEKFKIKKEKGYWLVSDIKIWLYDVVGLGVQYSATNYLSDFKKAFKKISAEGKLPIIVGGTGFYLKVLEEGLSNLQIKVNPSLRRELEKLSKDKLQEKLKEVNLKRWQGMNYSDRQNPRRLLRSIELSTYGFVDDKKEEVFLDRFDIFKIGLTASRVWLYQKSDFRVFGWFENGILKEVKKLFKNGVAPERFKNLGLEYGLIADFLINDKKNQQLLIREIQNKIHAYIRRQQTWFKKEKEVVWFDVSKKNYLSKIEKEVNKWYYCPDAAQN